MALAQLADKTTLDKIDTDVTTLKSRGGIKVANDDIYGFDIANDEWVKVNIRNMTGANPTLIVINKDMTMTGKPVTVSNGTYYSRTQVMPNAKFDVFALPKLGNYVVSWTSAGKAKSKVVTVDQLGGVTTDVICYPNFATATWTEIANMLAASYRGDVDLSEIWDIGSTRSVDFSASDGGGGGTSGQPAQTQNIVILDYNYDTLTTPIGEVTKAAMTCGVRMSGTTINSNDDRGYRSGWEGQPLRAWVNTNFYNSLPAGLKALVKPVQKANTQNTLSENCTLISTAEYNGTNKYEYLKDSANIDMFNSVWTRNGYHNGSIGASYWIQITSNYGTTERSYYAIGNVACIFSL